MKVLIICVYIDALGYVTATDAILALAKSPASYYVCAANVHMLMEAYDSVNFRKIVNEANFAMPDGMPLVWMMRLKGIHDQQRVYGPTLMLYILEAAAKEKIPVGFYGGTPDVLKALVENMAIRHKGLNIAFSYSPPFRELSPAEDAILVSQINESNTRILFVGLGCPKQEVWMAQHRGRIKGVMLGVGAAFDFHAGAKKQAPAWMQKIGLEWLFRLINEPARLWKRYFFHNPRFVALALADLLGFIK